MKALAAEGYTMVVVTHEMDLPARCPTRWCVLEKGLLIEKAPPEKFFTQPDSEQRQAVSAKQPLVRPASPAGIAGRGCVGFRLIPVDSERLPRLTHRHHLHPVNVHMRRQRGDMQNICSAISRALSGVVPR